MPITLRTSLKTLKLHLWDEESRRLVGFRHLKQMRQEARTDGLIPSAHL